MTKKTLEKLEGTTCKFTLENKKAERKRVEEAGHHNAAEAIKGSIAGYVQAMRDCGVITESERRVLFIYYATV